MPKLLGWLMFVAGGIGTLGCADLGVTNPPLSTIPQQPVYAEQCHLEYPCYERLDDIPAEITPQIISIHPVVYWDGSRAVGSSVMHYFGNRAEESFTLTITGPSSATRTAEAASTAAIIPWYATHTTPGFTLAAPNGKSCGHHAQLTSIHQAISTAWLEFRGFGELRVMKPGGDDRPQPECTCSGGSGPGDEPVLSTAPNFTPSATCSGGGGGGGGGDGGSNLRCYSVTIEHYYYYPDTGAVEYRYSEQYSYCEQVE